MDVLILILVLIVSVIVWFYLKNKKIYEYAAKIPGPPAYPIVGNYFDFASAKNGSMAYMSELHDKYGKTTKFWIGLTFYSSLSNPEDAETLLKDTTNLRKADDYAYLMPWLGNGLVTAFGKHWHGHRKILTPAFHFKITDRFLEVFNEKGKVLLKKLSKHSGQQAFNVFPYINLYALDAIIESAMGIQLNVQENEDNEYIKAVHRMSSISTERAFNPFFSSDFIFSLTGLGKEQVQCLKVLHGQCDSVIKQRKEQIEHKKEDVNLDEDLGIKKRLAFLDLLLEGQKKGNGLTDQDIRDEVNTFMFAGHDTTTAGISFTLYHLSNEQEIQQKAYEEIVDIMGDEENITLDHLAEATYLEQIIKESMRISPPVPMVSRKLESDVQLKDYILPANSLTAIFIYKIHHNPEIYPNPEKFDPERFTKDNISKRHPFSYVPFSAGARNCIGQKYAQLEMKATLMKILRKFQILPGGKIDNLQAEIVLKAPQGHFIKVKSR